MAARLCGPKLTGGFLEFCRSLTYMDPPECFKQLFHASISEAYWDLATAVRAT